MAASEIARKAVEYFDLTLTHDIVVRPPLKFKRPSGVAAEPGEEGAGAHPASPSAAPALTTFSTSGAASAPAPAVSPRDAASAASPAMSPSAAAGAPAPVVSSPVGGSAPAQSTIAEKAHKHSTFGQWAALFAGVMIQPFFQAYQATHKWAFDGLGGWAFFALITSVLIFPAVYRNAFDKDKPVALQLAPIFAAGLGWQSLLTTAIKAAGH